MKVSKNIWEENDKIIGEEVPVWYWYFWGFFVMPIGWILTLYCKLGLIGGCFVTPLRLKNVKKVHEDGSRSIRFYDKHTIVL